VKNLILMADSKTNSGTPKPTPNEPIKFGKKALIHPLNNGAVVEVDLTPRRKSLISNEGKPLVVVSKNNDATQVGDQTLRGSLL
jgi:hypothetical protein